jgi:leader peptidase (prepilin peptidase)/N-methyltransferase
MSTIFFAGLCALLGLCVGSFLNVVIHRLPKMMEASWRQQCAEINGDENIACEEPLTLAKPRSRCPHCQHAIAPWENIPVLSFLLLRGKCSSCKATISIRYPLVEALTAAISGAAGWYFDYSLQACGALLLIWALIALSFIDFDTQLLPDSITLPLLWLGLLFNLGDVFTGLPSAVIGAVAGYMSLWLVYWAFKLFTGKEGMGYGDFKLLAALGAWMGWQMLPAIVLLSSLVGAFVGIGLIVFARHGRNVPIPFGPYLAGAGLIALFWGKQLTQGYLGLVY